MTLDRNVVLVFHCHILVENFVLLAFITFILRRKSFSLIRNRHFSGLRLADMEGLIRFTRAKTENDSCILHYPRVLV